MFAAGGAPAQTDAAKAGTYVVSRNRGSHEERTPMNTLEALTTRRSCRSYLPDPVPAELIDQILEAGTFAPTGMGRQSPIIVAITNKEVRDELSRLNAAVDGRRGRPVLRRAGGARGARAQGRGDACLRRQPRDGQHAQRRARARARQLLDPSREGGVRGRPRGARSSTVSGSMRTNTRASATASWAMPPRPRRRRRRARRSTSTGSHSAPQGRADRSARRHARSPHAMPRRVTQNACGAVS